VGKIYPFQCRKKRTCEWKGKQKENGATNHEAGKDGKKPKPKLRGVGKIMTACPTHNNTNKCSEVGGGKIQRGTYGHRYQAEFACHGTKGKNIVKRQS